MSRYLLSSKRTLRIYKKIACIYDILHHLQTLWVDDILRKAVIRFSRFKRGDMVLDTGTGTCLTAIMAARYNSGISIVGVDVSKEMLEQGRKNIMRYDLDNRVSLVNTNLECLPFPDSYFDKIIVTLVIGGVKTPRKVMRELVRVSKPGTRITMAEVTRPHDNKILELFYDFLIEPWIKYFWEFRSLNLHGLYKKAGINVDTCFKIMGIASIVSGIVLK